MIEYYVMVIFKFFRVHTCGLHKFVAILVASCGHLSRIGDSRWLGAHDRRGLATRVAHEFCAVGRAPRLLCFIYAKLCFEVLLCFCAALGFSWGFDSKKF